MGQAAAGAWPQIIKATAKNLGSTAQDAQIIIRCALQQHQVVIPKSSNRRRILEDADVFDFE
ncbi:MAG: aldo/keto reductase, partial [Candidatus Binatia bacterium]